MRGRLLFAILFIFLNYYSSAQTKKYEATPRNLGFVLPEGKRKLSIPFELNNSLIIIKVLINNNIPLSFILDTGVKTTILTEKAIADLLGLHYSHKIKIPGIGGNKFIDAYVTNNVTLALDGITGKGHSLIVLEEDLLQLRSYLGHNVYGILGYSLFSRFIVKINYSAKIITFYDPKYYKKKSRFTKHPLMVEDTKPYLLVDFSLKDSTIYTGKFMLDTGASHSFLLDKNVDSSYYIPTPSIYSHLGRGLGGDLFGHITRINTVSIAPFTFQNVIATFPDSSSYSIARTENRRDGTIGGGVLSRFVVVFDFINENLYLKKGSTYKNPFEYNLSGLIIKTKGENLKTYEIVEIREGSTAQLAGVLPGDKILTINGQSTSNITLGQVLNLINIKANKYVRMIVQRDNKKVKTFFRLERRI